MGRRVRARSRPSLRKTDTLAPCPYAARDASPKSKLQFVRLSCRAASDLHNYDRRGNACEWKAARPMAETALHSRTREVE